MIDLKRRQNVLIIGSGSREHALSWALEKSKHVDNVYVAPGNAGTAPKNCAIDINSNEAVLELCKQRDINLVIVGSETLLAQGITDFLTANSVDVFGPTQEAALIETDKAFTRRLCKEAGIPSPRYHIFDQFEPLKNHLEKCPAPIVLKDSFLCAGKGVTVDSNRRYVIECAQAIFDKKRLEQTVVVEEYLHGTEISAFVLCDGRHVLYLGDALDYKRIGNNNTGENTGGMGAISPSPIMTASLQNETINKFVKPTLEYLERRGIKYKGVIFLGLMLTDNGLKLLEFNARLGDPETQALLPRLDCDLMELISATVNGTLNKCKVQLSDEHSACVVMASNGYPGNYEKGTRLVIPYTDDALLFHSNTQRQSDGSIIATGGRTLSVVGLGCSIQEAKNMAYETVRRIQWPEGYYRTDIADIATIS